MSRKLWLQRKRPFWFHRIVCPHRFRPICSSKGKDCTSHATGVCSWMASCGGKIGPFRNHFVRAIENSMAQNEMSSSFGQQRRHGYFGEGVETISDKKSAFYTKGNAKDCLPSLWEWHSRYIQILLLFGNKNKHICGLWNRFEW